MRSTSLPWHSLPHLCFLAIMNPSRLRSWSELPLSPLAKGISNNYCKSQCQHWTMYRTVTLRCVCWSWSLAGKFRLLSSGCYHWNFPARDHEQQTHFRVIAKQTQRFQIHRFLLKHCVRGRPNAVLCFSSFYSYLLTSSYVQFATLNFKFAFSQQKSRDSRGRTLVSPRWELLQEFRMTKLKLRVIKIFLG